MNIFISTKSKSLILLSTALTLAGCQTPFMNTQPVFNQRNLTKNVKASNFKKLGSMPGEIIVKFKRGASSASIQSTTKSLGLLRIKSSASPLGIKVFKAGQGSSISRALQSLKNNPAVLYAEPNRIYSVPEVIKDSAPQSSDPSASYPNDPSFSRQYAHKVSMSQKGWEINKGNSNVTVAIVDTGVDGSHPDLAAKMVPGYDFVEGQAGGNIDPQGHGTHVAGISAAITNNGVGVAGYAPNVKIMPVRVLDARGSGSFKDVADGIVWAAENGAKVINMSLGGPWPSQAVTDAVKFATSKDVVVIAAMGNDGNGSKSYPAATEGVMAVGATDSSDKRARFSQYGNWISVGAPGVGILSTFPTKKSGMPGINYGSISGTSMATPAVAGLAALVRSQFPTMNYKQVQSHIESTADDLGEQGFDKYYGYGRINVFKALSTNPDNALQAFRRMRIR